MEIIKHKDKYYCKTNDGYREVLASTDKSLKSNIRIACKSCKASGIKFDENHNPNSCLDCNRTGIQLELLPQLPTSFIQYYIEQYNIGNKIEKIMVEYEDKYILAPFEWFTNYTYGRRSMVGKEIYTEEKGICIIKDISLPGGYCYLVTDKGSIVWNYQLNKTIFIKDKISLKLNSNNEISIKPIKTSWNREEVINLIGKFREDLVNCIGNKGLIGHHQWSKQNL